MSNRGFAALPKKFASECGKKAHANGNANKFTPETAKIANSKRKYKSVIDRFEEKIECITESGCWLWTGAITSRGYGLATVNREQILTHRLSYELFRGPIPKGMVIDHLCRTSICVNPNHLEIVTQAENVKRGNSIKGKSNAA